MKIIVGDLIFFESPNKETYRDCVQSIIHRDVEPGALSDTIICCHSFDIYLLKEEVMMIIRDSDAYVGVEPDYFIKEIWHQVDKDTYKKIYEDCNGILREVNYYEDWKRAR